MQDQQPQPNQPGIRTFKDDATRLIEAYQRPIILGSLFALVLGMWAISHGCDQNKAAQIERQRQNAKKFNTAPGLPESSTINGQKRSIEQQEAADRAAQQQAAAALADCISKLPTGLPEAQYEALKTAYCNAPGAGTVTTPAAQTSGVYNNPTPYPTSGAPAPAETKKSLAQEAYEARKRRELAAYTAPPSDDESGSPVALKTSDKSSTGDAPFQNASYNTPEPVNPQPPSTSTPAKSEDKSLTEKRPKSCLGLCEGRIIQGLLVNTLNGDFTGPVIVQVDVPLVDFSTNEIIIPAGAIALGESHAVSGFRQSRLAITFHKIQLRDGRIIYLDNKEPGLSQEGEAGLKDKVNNHWTQTFGAALVIGAIGALAQAGNSYSSYGYDPGVAMRNGISQQTGQTADRVLDKFLNIPPSIKERHGLRAALFVMGDIPGWSRRTEQ